MHEGLSIKSNLWYLYRRAANEKTGSSCYIGKVKIKKLVIDYLHSR